MLDAAGRLYFATVDGYLHAYEADGRYRFSTTVAGTPVGRLLLREPGTLLLTTADSKVHSLDLHGSRRSSFSAPSPFNSSLALLVDGAFVYAARDGWLYALSSSGGSRYRARIPARSTGHPEVSAHGVVWVPLSDGVARFQGARLASHLKLGAAIEKVVLQGEKAVAAGSGKVWFLDETGALLHWAPAEQVSGGCGGVAWVHHDQLEWHRDGGEVRQHDLEVPAQLSAAPLVLADELVIPLRSGQAALVSSSGRQHVLPVTGTALATPFEAGGRLVFRAGDGTICVLTRSNQ